ncbi:MAG: phytoene/squalene synthase family protein [Pseudolabrys sp.]
MQPDFTHSTALVRSADRDRYLAALFAPAEHRDALLALYAFAIEIARVADLVREPMAGEIRLQWWREAIEGKREGEAAAHPVAAALRAVMQRYHIAADRLTAIVDAHTADLYDAPLKTLDDLDNYAALTQGALMGVAAGMLGATGFEVQMMARHAGIAQAVFGALVAPARCGLLLPDEVLERHGVERADLAAGQESEGLRAALAELRRHARRQLAAAQGEGGAVPAAMLPVLLPLAVLGPQLRLMERRGYEPFLFEPLSALRRQWLIWRASRDPQRIFATV